MNKSMRRLAAIAVTGAMTLAGVALGASAAQADAINPNGTIKLFAAGSNVGTIASKQITSGSSATNPMFWGITIDQACPAGFRDGATIQVFQGGARKGALSLVNEPANDGVYGTNGLKPADTSIAMDESSTVGSQNPYVVNNRSLDQIANPLTTGAFEIRYYCTADRTGIDYDSDKYFSLALNYDGAAHTWSTPAAPVQKVNTTVSLTAASNADKTATLTATVKKADGTVATNASGTVSFSEGASTIGTGTIANGVATFTTAALAAGSHSFTAGFAGDANYNASPASGAATVFIAGNNAAATTITVAIPSGIGGITLSGVPTAVNLGTAALTGGRLVASNHSDFTNLTVNDTRQLDAPDWTLTGKVTDFKTADNKTLLGKYLGWKPWILSGPGVAGPGVTAGNGNGLTDLSTLATGKVTDGQPTTVVKADLDLSAPSNTPGGTYNATLTVTLS
jgi:hypothetical protein